jgi:hypothetical protein
VGFDLGPCGLCRARNLAWAVCACRYILPRSHTLTFNSSLLKKMLTLKWFALEFGLALELLRNSDEYHHKVTRVETTVTIFWSCKIPLRYILRFKLPLTLLFLLDPNSNHSKVKKKNAPRFAPLTVQHEKAVLHFLFIYSSRVVFPTRPALIDRWSSGRYVPVRGVTPISGASVMQMFGTCGNDSSDARNRNERH